MVVGEKKFFYEAYEEVGVARSHFGSHCNTVDLFVVVVTKRKTVECERRRSEDAFQSAPGNFYVLKLAFFQLFYGRELRRVR